MATLDHLVYATPDLGMTRSEIERTWSVQLATGGSHAGFGTANALISFGGGSYFELVGPDPDQDVEPALFGVSRLTEPKLVAFAATVTDIDHSVDALRRVGHDPGEPIVMTRLLPDGGTLSWRLTQPSADDGGTIPFLIDWGTSPHPSTTLPSGITLESFTISHPYPDQLRAVHAALGLDLPVSRGPVGLRAVIGTPRGLITLT